MSRTAVGVPTISGIPLLWPLGRCKQKSAGRYSTAETWPGTTKRDPRENSYTITGNVIGASLEVELHGPGYTSVGTRSRIDLFEVLTQGSGSQLDCHGSSERFNRRWPKGSRTA